MMSDNAITTFRGPSSYWVISNLFLVGQYPGGIDGPTTVRRLECLYELGVRSFIDLTVDGEKTSHGVPIISYKEFLIEKALYAKFSIEDGTAPSKDLMKSILDRIDACIADVQPLYLHCRGGKFRTGTVVGCYLARHNISSGVSNLKVENATRVNTYAEHANLLFSQKALIESWAQGE